MEEECLLLEVKKGKKLLTDATMQKKKRNKSSKHFVKTNK